MDKNSKMVGVNRRLNYPKPRFESVDITDLKR